MSAPDDGTTAAGNEAQVNCMRGEATVCVRKAAAEDLPVLRGIIGESRDRTPEHLRELFHVDTGQPDQHDHLKEAIASEETAFFLGSLSTGAPSAALWCRHLENAPPVYQPERSILSVNAFHSSTDEMVIVGPHLLDAAIRWAKSVSKRAELFVSAVTWEYDTAWRTVARHFHKTSTLVEREGFHELFTLEGQDARMRPATEWYFGRAHAILSALQRERHPVRTRRAIASDLPHIVELSRRKRHDYARYQPVFWRPADGAEEKQLDFFGWLLQQEAPLLFVSEASDGSLNGFIIALRTERLPLNDPALRLGHGLHIDDFVVGNDSLWSTAGRELLFAAIATHAERVGDDATVNVLSGAHDTAKRSLMESDANMRSLFSWDILPAGNRYTGVER